MSLDETHILLFREPDREVGRRRVINFFAKNFLVKYDKVKIVEERSFSAEEPDFWQVVEEGIEDNRRVMARLIGDLKEAGFSGIDDLAKIPQGYQSKILHTVAHLLDGFFGIDTSFYNQEEDSSWLSDGLTETIKKQPGEFRVFTVECTSENSASDLVAKLRKFETGF